MKDPETCFSALLLQSGENARAPAAEDTNEQKLEAATTLLKFCKSAKDGKDYWDDWFPRFKTLFAQYCECPVIQCTLARAALRLQAHCWNCDPQDFAPMLQVVRDNIAKPSKQQALDVLEELCDPANDSDTEQDERFEIVADALGDPQILTCLSACAEDSEVAVASAALKLLAAQVFYILSEEGDVSSSSEGRQKLEDLLEKITLSIKSYQQQGDLKAAASFAFSLDPLLLNLSSAVADSSKGKALISQLISLLQSHPEHLDGSGKELTEAEEEGHCDHPYVDACLVALLHLLVGSSDEATSPALPHWDWAAAQLDKQQDQHEQQKEQAAEKERSGQAGGGVGLLSTVVKAWMGHRFHRDSMDFEYLERLMQRLMEYTNNKRIRTSSDDTTSSHHTLPATTQWRAAGGGNVDWICC